MERGRALMARMARAGIAPPHLKVWWDAERGRINPFEEPDTQTELYRLIADLWSEAQAEDLAARGYGEPTAEGGFMPETFQLVRGKDQSGVSGIGVVLEGVMFSDGITVIRWLSDKASVAVWDSFADFIEVHVAAHPENLSVIRWGDGREIKYG